MGHRNMAQRYAETQPHLTPIHLFMAKMLTLEVCAHLQYCVRYKVSQFRSPAGVRYYSNTTELISSDISCVALRDIYPPLDNSFRVGPGEEQPTTPDNCETFPRYNSVVDIMLASFIVAAIALPIKVITWACAVARCWLYVLLSLKAQIHPAIANIPPAHFRNGRAHTVLFGASQIILKTVFNIRRRLSFSSLWVKNTVLQATIDVG